MVSPRADLLKYVTNAILAHLKSFRGLPPNASSELFAENIYVKSEWSCSFPLVMPTTSPITFFHASEIPLQIKFPSREEIHALLHSIVSRASLAQECMIILLIYVERLIHGGVMLLPSNWKPVVLASLLISSKMWEDLSRWNIEFRQCTPEYSQQAINKLEIQFCQFLDFRLHISAADYARYYFRLRMEQFPSAPKYARMRWKNNDIESGSSRTPQNFHMDEKEEELADIPASSRD